MKNLIRLLAAVSTVALGALACGPIEEDSSCSVDESSLDDGGVSQTGDAMQRSVWGQTIVWPANLAASATTGKTLIDIAINQSCEPRAFGIQMGLTYATNPAIFVAGAKTFVVAQVDWGALGGNFSAILDVVPGGSTFNVIGHSVRVTIFDRSFYLGTPPTASPFTVTGSAAPHPLQSKWRPTLTAYSTGGSSFGVPAFAKRMSVVRLDSTSVTSDYIVNFQDVTNTTVANVNIPAGADLTDFPIPNAIKRINIVAGAGNTDIFVVFELDL